MCANRKRDMPISLSTTALVMMVAVIATVGMTTVSAAGIETEIVSSIKSLSCGAGHSGHKKIQVIKIINKNTDKEGVTPNTFYRINNKVGNYYGLCDHPLKTLVSVGFSTFYISDRYCVRCDQPCPLRLPANTALSQQFQFLIWSGLETFSGQAVDAGLVKTEGLAGNLRGQTRYSILSESDLPSTAKKRVFRGSEATEVRIES